MQDSEVAKSLAEAQRMLEHFWQKLDWAAMVHLRAGEVEAATAIDMARWWLRGVGPIPKEGDKAKI